MFAMTEYLTTAQIASYFSCLEVRGLLLEEAAEPDESL